MIEVEKRGTEIKNQSGFMPKDKKIMYEKEKQQIALLEAKISEYEAASELNSAQQDVLNEMRATAHELKMELPGPCLTWPGGDSGRQANNTRSTPRPAGGKNYRTMFALGQSLDRGGFQNFNEFLTVISSQRFDNRLQNTMSEGTPSSGGFLVPQEFSAKLLDSSLESEIVRPRATVWPMKSDTLKVPGWDASSHASTFAAVAGFPESAERVSKQVLVFSKNSLQPGRSLPGVTR